ncbi:MAG TPA: 16S rRNA processing protein RimM [Chitinophagaceae bacterium]|nr:16S rRNA processing protein RimM [Chitinophagaceae bacterium]
MKHYRSIGKLVASFGLKGEIILLHSLGKKTSLKGLEVIFVEQKKDELLPWFIESTRIKSDTEIFLKLEGVHTKEQTFPLLQKQAWLPEEDFTKFAGKSAPIALVGFHIIHEGNDLGEILEVIELPHQLLGRIIINSKEALIPLHEETLLKIDRKKKQVHVNLPEGLLDVYS